MKTIVVKQNELLDIIKSINLVKVKFGEDDTWIIAPVLYTDEQSLDVIADLDILKYPVAPGEKVMLKFQRLGYEYLVNGEVCEVNKGYFTAITIKFSIVRKLYDQRRHMRFDTDLKTALKLKDGFLSEGTMKNISKAGAMIVSGADIELNSTLHIEVEFDSGLRFRASGKALRKLPWQGGGFSYGLQFAEMPEESRSVLNSEISRFEEEYLKTFTVIREYEKNTGTQLNAKVAIFSNNVDEGLELREALVKLGAQNFEIFHHFRFYIDFFIEEKPKLLIIDAEYISEEILKIINDIVGVYKDIVQTKVILILPMQHMELARQGADAVPSEVSVLCKPLIYNEFEDEILRYL